jgi:iron complex transport system substrate-binding protein
MIHMNKRILGLIAALIVALTAGCGLAENGALTVTDMMGREVRLAAPAARIVALTAADCEILCALGAGDTLVGRGAYCDYPAEVLDVPSVESGYETNIEQILGLEPQLVLMGKMAQSEAQAAMLESAGIAVAVSDAQDIQGVYGAVAMIGALTGKNAEAAALIADMKAGFDVLGETGVSGAVYFEVSPLEYGLWTTGGGTFLQEIADILGLTNSFADLDGWVQISEEQVIQRNPDYIVTLAADYGVTPSPVEEILSRAGWETVAAVRNGAVYYGSGDALTRPGPRLVEGARQLLDALSAP